jgi:hypothetical protein
MYNTKKEYLMKKWIAKLKNGSQIEENPTTSNWTQVKDEVIALEFDNNGQIISLPSNMSEYIQGKTASGDLISGKCTLESRFFGFRLGNNIVKVRINEKTNNISFEII